MVVVFGRWLTALVSSQCQPRHHHGGGVWEMVDCSRQQSMSAAPPFVGWLLRCCPPNSSRGYVARQREQSLAPHVASSDPLLLSALLSFCCAGWLLPVALPLLLASLPSLRLCQPPHRTGVVTVIAL
jgi:hypothetical protein